MKRGKPTHPFDPTLKALVDTSPGDWAALTGQPEAPAEVLDPDISFVRGAADKVIRIATSPPRLLHLEFEAGHDSSRLPRRMHLYNVALDDHYDLPVCSVVVLLRPEADSPQLTGERQRQFPGEEAHSYFRYGVIRVWQLPAKPLLEGGLGTLPLALVSDVSEAELPGVIDKMQTRLAERESRSIAKDVWAAAYFLLGLRNSPEVTRMLLRGSSVLAESSTYQATLAEGAVKALRPLVLSQGKLRLGRPSREVAKALNAIEDPQQLHELGLRVMTAKSWEELLGLPEPRKPRRRPKR